MLNYKLMLIYNSVIKGISSENTSVCLCMQVVYMAISKIVLIYDIGIGSII